MCWSSFNTTYITDNQCLQKSQVVHTFTSNESYAFLLHVEPSNLLFLKTYNTEFNGIIIPFMDQKGRPLEIEEKVKLTLLINKKKLHINETLF